MKRIIICCDGTWNKPGNRDRGKIVRTNVQKIYEAIDGGTSPIEQVKFYGQGVGTGFSFSNHFLGGATGLGIDANILDAYKFLMWNYSPGDQIYLFGFSRGAYTVRSLAGFIRNCGIMKPEYLNLIDEAYHLYRDRTSLTHPDSDLMKAFKRTYGINKDETVIRFMGVWDTVGALGIPLKLFGAANKKYQFHDVTLSSQIEFAYHALAIDEKRKIFRPALWEISDKAIKTPGVQTSEQVWFSGVHSNVGGGYEDEGLSDITLQWMIDKAANTGLEFDKQYQEKIKMNSVGELRKSRTGLYLVFPPLLREINNPVAIRTDPETGSQTTVRVVRNESIHYTCFERRYHLKKKYNPKNITVDVCRSTPYDPLKDQWEKDWLDYIEDWK